MNLPVLLKARDSRGCQDQEKHRQAVSKPSPSRARQALLQSLRNQRGELDAPPHPRHGSGKRCWALTPAGTKRKQIINSYPCLPSLNTSEFQPEIAREKSCSPAKTAGVGSGCCPACPACPAGPALSQPPAWPKHQLRPQLFISANEGGTEGAQPDLQRPGLLGAASLSGTGFS